MQNVNIATQPGHSKRSYTTQRVNSRFTGNNVTDVTTMP